MADFNTIKRNFSIIRWWPTFWGATLYRPMFLFLYMDLRLRHCVYDFITEQMK